MGDSSHHRIVPAGAGPTLALNVSNHGSAESGATARLIRPRRLLRNFGTRADAARRAALLLYKTHDAAGNRNAAIPSSKLEPVRRGTAYPFHRGIPSENNGVSETPARPRFKCVLALCVVDVNY
jgi:hypothetical protein